MARVTIPAGRISMISGVDAPPPSPQALDRTPAPGRQTLIRVMFRRWMGHQQSSPLFKLLISEHAVGHV